MPEPPSDFRIETLRPQHNREAFSCGVQALDDYLHRQARQDAEKKAAVVFVLTADGHTIAGYYTLSQFSVELSAMPHEIAKQMPKYPDVPATLLGRLAVALSFRGKRLGERLLMDALERALQGSRQIASTGVALDAKDADTAAFYKRYNFIELAGSRLFLPMRSIEKMFA
ncbi:MAG: GNAT family N-acetyltransferase [Candidatus Acidiferrales bacterium]